MKNIFKINKIKNKGFTLIEFSLVAALLLVLGSIFFKGFNNINNEQKIFKLADAMREAISKIKIHYPKRNCFGLNSDIAHAFNFFPHEFDKLDDSKWNPGIGDDNATIGCETWYGPSDSEVSLTLTNINSQECMDIINAIQKSTFMIRITTTSEGVFSLKSPTDTINQINISQKCNIDETVAELAFYFNM